VAKDIAVAWVESQSMSFSARHETRHADVAADLLQRLEEFRAELEGVFGRTPWDVAVVIHPSAVELALAHPWLPLARRFAAPASRRYFAGWFASGEIHVLAPEALAARASRVPGSREALARSPQHEYAHLALAQNNPALPPPFNFRTFRKYLELAWVCEGAATWLAGQTRFLRPAIARRLREGGPPAFPPSAADAQLLGGTVFSLLARAAGRRACVELVQVQEREQARAAIELAFARPIDEVEGDWREYLETFSAP
jgi:hypothetical protein